MTPTLRIGLFVLGVLSNGLDHINIDSFLKILIRGLILLAALIINIYAERLRVSRQASPSIGGNHVSASTTACTRVSSMMRAAGSACAKISAPPITHACGAPSAACNA